MTDPSDFQDTTRCPLCGSDNQCAIAAGREPESCWCMAITIDPQTLAAIPAEAQGGVCICEKCARAPAR